MKNVPVSVRAALNKRGRQDILDREGDYSQYEAEIQQIIHGNETPAKQPLVPDMGDRYEEELTPEESKAQDRIEELGKQYGEPVTTTKENKLSDLNKEDSKLINIMINEGFYNESDEFICYNDPDGTITSFNFEDVEDEYDTPEELLNDKEGDGFNLDTMKNTPENVQKLLKKYGGEIKELWNDEEISNEDNKITKEQDKPVTTDEPDPRVNETKMFEEFDSWAGPKDYTEQALNAIKWQGNWDVADMVRKEEWFGSDFDYDSMNDEELSDEFYERVESGEISGEDVFKALIGRMSDDDVKDYAEFYGLINEDDSEDISDDEISEALADYQWQITDKTTVDDYARETAEKLGVDKDRVLKMIKSESPDIKDTDKMAKVAGLEDEEQSERDQDIAKIQAITDRINSYDADSAEGYLTTDESKLIKELAQKHKLTADDLKKIGGRVFADYGYGIDKFAYKEPSPEEIKGQDFNKAVGSYIESDGSDQELDKSIKYLKDKGYSDEEIIKKILVMFKGTIR